MYVITSVFSNQQRIPVLLNDQRVPFLIPLTFTITFLGRNAYNTQRRYISVIKQLYQFYSTKKIDFEDLIIKGSIEKIISFLEEFLLTSLIYTKPESLESIEKFLIWIEQNYSKNNTLSISIRSKIQSFYRRRQNALRSNYKSLSHIEITELRKVIALNNINNPFRIGVRLRNWLIVETLLQSGIRIGELLKLKVNDFIRHEDRFYMRVNNYKGDSEDTRKIEPSNKNMKSYRTIAISPLLFELLNKYILEYRRPLREGKKMKLKHSYLFVSERGNPISTTAAQVVLQIIQKEIRALGYKINLSPHVLRHTFADKFLQFLTESKKLDMERAKDELKSICGWSISSSMPLRYAGKQINNMANAHNIQRLEKTENND